MANISEKLTENEAVKGLDYPIEVKVYHDGVQKAPSIATITVHDEGGTELVEDEDMAIDGSGTMTYTLLAANTADLEENAVMVISYTYNSIDYKAEFIWDCVNNKLKCSVIDDDLKKYYPTIADEIWESTTNYDDQIHEAFCIVKEDIKDKGRRPAMLIDGNQVRKLIILKTFQIIFEDFAKSGEDLWLVRADRMVEAYKDRFSKLIIKYDIDEDGVIDSDEKSITQAQVTFRR